MTVTCPDGEIAAWGFMEVFDAIRATIIDGMKVRPPLNDWDT